MPTTLLANGSAISIGSTQVEILGWTVDVGAYGSIGKAAIRTSIGAIRAAGLNAQSLRTGSSLAGNSLGGAIAGDPTGQGIVMSTPDIQIQQQSDTVFGGQYLHGFFKAPSYEVELWARDFAGPLFDCRRSLADLNYQQQTVSTLVKQLAQAANLTARINISNDPSVGAITDNDAVLNNRPDTLWNIIIYLARMIGATAYTTPDRQLIFEDISSNTSRHNYQWFRNTIQQNPNTNPDDSKPILSWEILDQPGRNKNFSVICVSHHPHTTQTSTQTITVMGEDLVIPGAGKSIPAGFYRGAQGGQVRNALSQHSLGVPIFEFHLKEGMKPAEVQATAEGYSRKIASKLLCMTIVVSGDISVKPNDTISVVDNSPNGDMLGFDGTTMYASAVSHHLNMPQSDMPESEGFLTSIKCLNLPPTGSLDSAALGDLLGG